MPEIKLKPLGNKVIVKPIEEDKTTPSGIVLPQTTEEKSEKGEVVAIGPGKLLENGSRAKLSIKVGDKVVFKQYSPDEIKIKQEKYLIISEEDILAVIE